MSSIDTTAMICNVSGYVVADTARRAFTSGGRGPVVLDGVDNGPSRNRPRFEMKNVVTGAVTEAGWQLGGARLVYNALANSSSSSAANYSTVPPADASATFATGVTGANVQMARTLWWTVMGYAVDRVQGGNINILGSLIDGFVGPMIGDQLAKMAFKA